MRVLDYDFNELALVNITDSKFPEDLPEMSWNDAWYKSVQENLHFLGEDIYVSLYENEPDYEYVSGSPVVENGLYTFKFKRSDLLKNDVKMEFIYKREVQEEKE